MGRTIAAVTSFHCFAESFRFMFDSIHCGLEGLSLLSLHSMSSNREGNSMQKSGIILMKGNAFNWYFQQKNFAYRTQRKQPRKYEN